jgi:hypothetical protein
VGNKPLPWFAALQEAYAAVLPPKERDDFLKPGPTRPHLQHSDINLTQPEWSRVLTRHLAKSAGGLADDAQAAFKTKADPRYQKMLQALEQGKAALLAKPRMDMPGATPIPQPRDFGRTF